MRQTRQDRGIGITTVPLVGGLRALPGGNCLFRKRKGHTAVQASEATGGVPLYEPRPIHEPRRTPLEGPLGGTSNAVGRTSWEGHHIDEVFPLDYTFRRGRQVGTTILKVREGLLYEDPRKRTSRRGRKRGLKLHSPLSRKSIRVFYAHRREGGLGLRKCGHLQTLGCP